MFHLNTPWKRQKTYGFLTFNGGIEMERWLEMGYDKINSINVFPPSC